MIVKKEKLLRTLFTKPEYWFHMRELARATGLHPNIVSTLTDQLKKEKLILKRKHKHLVEVACNRDDLTYKRKKQLVNFAILHESGLIDYLVDFYNHPSAIVVFGSFARGEDWSESDIDLAVISSSKKVPDLGSFEKKLSRNIHLLPLEYKDLSPELYNNLINGFVLYGYFKDERVTKLSGKPKGA